MNREINETANKIPDAEKILSHEKISLWGSNVPCEIENCPLKATIQAYLVEGSRSCVVIFPGGGYFQLSEDSEGNDIAREYNKMGISAFVACYRYRPYGGNAILADGQRAIQYVRYYADCFGIDKDKIAVCGFSAGGHLAMLVCEHPCVENIIGDEIGKCDSRPNACILGYPVVTFEDGTFITMPEIFLGDEKNDPELLAKYSYRTNIELMPPTFSFYSVNDTAVDGKKNSEALHSVLTESGKKSVCRCYSDGGHGIGLGKQYKEFSAWLPSSAGFLKELGF